MYCTLKYSVSYVQRTVAYSTVLTFLTIETSSPLQRELAELDFLTCHVVPSEHNKRQAQRTPTTICRYGSARQHERVHQVQNRCILQRCVCCTPLVHIATSARSRMLRTPSLSFIPTAASHTHTHESLSFSLCLSFSFFLSFLLSLFFCLFLLAFLLFFPFNSITCIQSSC